MALARTYALVPEGHMVHRIMVTAEITEGLPEIGLPDHALRQAADRIRAAIINSGEDWPSTTLAIRLSPLRLPARASSLDLAIAMAILAADGAVPHDQLDSILFMAELGLDGRLRAVPGLPDVLEIIEQSALREVDHSVWLVVVAIEDLSAASAIAAQRLVPNLRVIGAPSLGAVAFWLRSSLTRRGRELGAGGG